LDADCLVLQNIDELFHHPQLSAAMDCCDHFNTGVLVLEPNKRTFQDMLDKLKQKKIDSYDGADQGFLNNYFLNSYHPLSFKYNGDQYVLARNKHAYNEKDLKVIHYVHEHKPWLKEQPEGFNEKLKSLHELWWKVHDAKLYNE
jgi:lipopolysaccharide biosynthesis glycosyltransferase